VSNSFTLFPLLDIRENFLPHVLKAIYLLPENGLNFSWSTIFFVGTDHTSIEFAETVYKNSLSGV
jgi:hypothetical protein